MEPVHFNGKVYRSPRRLLIAVLDYLPSKCLGLMYLANAVRLIKLRRFRDDRGDIAISIKMPNWFCHKCGITATNAPDNGVCTGCGHKNGKRNNGGEAVVVSTDTTPAPNPETFVDDDGTILYTPIKKLKGYRAERLPNSGDKSG